MKKNKKPLLDENLRRQAEARLSESAKKETTQPMKEADTLRLLHELQVHQIELEMQNEQLVQSQAEVEAGLKHYADLYNELYDFAPVGYFTLGRDGTIQRVNLTGARLLGVQRSKLVRLRFGAFVSAEFRLTFKDFLEKVFANHGKETYEAALLKDAHELFWVHLEAVIEDELREECRVVMVDITERKQVEIELQQHKEDIELINEELAQSRVELEAALRQYSDLYDFAPVGYFTLNRDGIILQANLAGARLLGVEYGKLIKQNFETFISAGSRPAFNAFFEKLLASQGKEICELEFLKDGNGPIWASIDASSFEGGLESRAVVVDISVRKHAEQTLQASENRFRMLLQDVPTIAVQGYGMDGTTQYWNFASERLYGYSAQEALGRNLLDLIIPPEMRSEVRQSIQQMVETGQPVPAAESSLMRKDGSRVTVYTCYTIVTNPGRDPELFCLDVDLTERKQVEDELRRAKESIETAHLELQHLLEHEQILARTDGLTGLCNRRYFFELAIREFNATLRYQRSLTIILFDVDGFKQVNDTFGHATGDKVLILISEAAAEQVRAVDVLARYGGDEFIVLLPQTSAQQAFLIAERIRESVAALQVEMDSGSLAVTLSIGIAEAIMSQDGSVEKAIRRADKALYAAKQAGNNCTVIYE